LALEKVKEVLDKLDWAEQLYPSGRSLGNAHPIYHHPVFVSRLKLLCLWYNITVWLRVKIGLLRRTLFLGINPVDIPWPDLTLGIMPENTLQNSATEITVENEIDSDKSSAERVTKVRFNIATPDVSVMSDSTIEVSTKHRNSTWCGIQLLLF
jgi:hypothetical protein